MPQKSDTSDVAMSLAAVFADACAILLGYYLATYIRFDSNWIPLLFDRPDRVYASYTPVFVAATVVMLFILQALGLYIRPQIGSFASKIPRIVRAVTLGTLSMMGIAFVAKNYIVELSSITVVLSALTVGALVLITRLGMFRLEIHLAEQVSASNRLLVIGVDSVAAHLKRAYIKEPRLRCEVTGFLRAGDEDQSPEIAEQDVLGSLDDIASIIQTQAIDKVILTRPDVGRARMIDLVLLCERNLVTFNMVPDVFSIITRSIDVQSVDDIPLIGVGRWPLDIFWNRAVKRSEDILGALVGLALSIPVIVVAALAIKRTSPGPVFYTQTRCGENGREFTLYKLRTMHTDAEAESGPAWTVEDDPRRTRIGAALRAHNVDELPQFWNVLCGHMSLVGPRPERPHFVEKFRDDIERYMWRHVSKPGMTGWAQVNGLRGDTSIRERIKYDLWYLENWSLSLDFKILLRTFFTRNNAY